MPFTICSRSTRCVPTRYRSSTNRTRPEPARRTAVRGPRRRRPDPRNRTRASAPGNALTLAQAASPASGVRCPSTVRLCRSCPATLLTMASDTPTPIITETAVWRRACSGNGGSPAASRSRRTSRETLFGGNGAPLRRREQEASLLPPFGGRPGSATTHTSGAILWSAAATCRACFRRGSSLSGRITTGAPRSASGCSGARFPAPPAFVAAATPIAASAFGVLLVFDHGHGLALGDREHVGKTTEDAANVLDVPGPAAVAVRAALTEVLGLEADDLVEQHPVLVHVPVRGDDPARAARHVMDPAAMDPSPPRGSGPFRMPAGGPERDGTSPWRRNCRCMRRGIAGGKGPAVPFRGA